MPIIGDVRFIELTQGKYAIVDALDYEYLAQWRWYAVKDARRDVWYACRSNYIPGIGSRRVPMHRAILNATPDVQVDHEDGNGLNNTRRNIRIATLSQNQFNKKTPKNNTSGHKGISREKRTGRWFVNFRANKRPIFVGCFTSLDDAIVAYERAARDHHGEFAKW